MNTIEQELDYLTDDTGRWYMSLGSPYEKDGDKLKRRKRFIDFVDRAIDQAKQEERDRINAEMETFIRKRYSIKSFIEAMRKVLT